MKPKKTVFTYNTGTPGTVDMTGAVPATIGSYEDYFDTGIIPWDIDNPSQKAQDMIQLLGLTRIVEDVKKNRKKRKKKLDKK